MSAGHIFRRTSRRRTRAATLKLVNVTSGCTSCSSSRQLVTVFETFDSEAKALASFGSLSAWQIP
jgi:hypothetical protein